MTILAPRMATGPDGRPWWAAPPLASGTAEALKWFAFVLMVGDHLNKYLWHDGHPALFDAGRMVMPLFAWVLAANLARRPSGERTAHQAVDRVMLRLLLSAAVATVPFVALGGLIAGWYPLNILFTLLAGVGVVRLWDADAGPWLAMRRIAAGALFVFAGLWVEFWWPGIAVFVASWAVARRPSAAGGLAYLLALASLGWINGNAWALAAIPVLWLATHLTVAVPRVRGLFYVLYPAHLALLCLVAQPLPTVTLKL